MPLPLLEELSNLELLRLADNPDEIIARIFVANRILKMRPITELQPEELIWLACLYQTGGLLKQMLIEMPLDELVKCWARETGRKRGRGNPRGTTFIYDLAQAYYDRTGKGKMEIYQELVLPLLVEFGEIQTDSNGDPDPIQDQEYQRSYLKALQRRKSRHTPRK